MIDKEILASLRGDGSLAYRYLQKNVFYIFGDKAKKMGLELEDIKEIFHESIIEMYQLVNKPHFILKKTTTDLLLGIAKNKCSEKIRENTKIRKIKTIVKDGNEEPDAERLAGIIKKENDLTKLEKALAQLDKKDRRILDFFYFKGKSMKEIGRLMKLTEGTAKKYKYKAMNNLKAIYFKA